VWVASLQTARIASGHTCSISAGRPGAYRATTLLTQRGCGNCLLALRQSARDPATLQGSATLDEQIHDWNCSFRDSQQTPHAASCSGVAGGGVSDANDVFYAPGRMDREEIRSGLKLPAYA